MCSTVDQTRGAARGPRLGTLIAHTRELTDAITADLTDPDAPADLAALHVDAVAAQLRDLLAVADQARAAAAVLTGVVDRAVSGRELIEGTYASTKRFFEVEAGLAPRSATALAARARDLRDAADHGDPRLRYGWLSGALSDDKVRELTLGIRAAVKHHPAAERDRLTSEALDLLLPLARTHTVAQLKQAIARLRFVLDPDGVRQAELDAYTEQSLTCVPVGHLVHLSAFLDPEAAAAVMTVLTQQVDGWRAAGDLAAEDRLPDGVDPDSAEGRRHQRARNGHLLALALGEVMTGLLGRSEVGMHHGIRPHTVHARRRPRPPRRPRRRAHRPRATTNRSSSRATRSAASCATPASPTSSPNRPAAGRRPSRGPVPCLSCSARRRSTSSTSDVRSAPPHHDCAVRWKPATGTARHRAAGDIRDGATPTTSSTGNTAATPRSRTASCCARDTIEPCTPDS